MEQRCKHSQKTMCRQINRIVPLPRPQQHVVIAVIDGVYVIMLATPSAG
jgi:hypothetical protein